MKSSTRCAIAPLAVTLALALACNRPANLPAADAAKSDTSQQLPFDRQPQSAGISPSHAFIPSVTRLPEGTPLTVCLQRDLSSASANAGDRFAATLDTSIAIDGQTLVARGAVVSGRVLEAKHSAGPRDPGYLRIALVSLTVGEKPVPIETSSLFAKGGSHDTRSASAPKEIVLSPERRLSFRLAQNVNLQ
jgi:hypothetical protein